MEKFKSFMKKLKKNMLIYIVVWLIFAILLVPPITYTITNAIMNGQSWLEGIVYNLLNNIFKLPIIEVIKEPYIKDYITGLEVFTVIFIIILIKAILKTLPKGEYDKIEHGSSDWCEKGEQYKVLSKDSGLILAKDNYLPVDKPGNINVLIVGRIWIW